MASKLRVIYRNSVWRVQDAERRCYGVGATPVLAWRCAAALGFVPLFGPGALPNAHEYLER